VDPLPDRELLDGGRDELDAVARHGVTRDELEHVREHLRGLLLLGAESTENRMIRLAKNHLLFGRHVPLSETAAKIARVTLDEVHAAARDILDLAVACWASSARPSIRPGCEGPVHDPLRASFFRRPPAACA
jgi:predicted Zn-dependent peptidase